MRKSKNISWRTLTLSKEDLEWAAEEDLISKAQASQLWDALVERHAEAQQFDTTHLFWYAGAILVLISMGWLSMEIAFRYSASVLFTTLLIYTVLFLLGGSHLWYRQHLKVPGGLLVTLAVMMVPIVVSSLLEALGYTMSVYLGDAGFQALLEGMTIAAALVALRFFHSPLLIVPLAGALWALSITVGTLLFQDWNKETLFTMFSGIGIAFIGFLVDGKRDDNADYAFWFYLFGVSAFWFSLVSLVFEHPSFLFVQTHSEWVLFIYFIISLGMMMKSVLLSRRIFLIYGALGVFHYLEHLAYTLFAGSILFPFTLTLIGIGIIWAGVKYHKHQADIDGAILSLLPPTLRDRLPWQDERS